jgi:hypothetical protein
MAEWIESPEHDESAVPDIEPRRGEGAEAQSEAARESATVFHEASDLDVIHQQRIAIYLIERKAIEFRRMRWMAGYDFEEFYRNGDLAKYGRPQAYHAEVHPSGVRRVGAWLKSLFFGG